MAKPKPETYYCWKEPRLFDGETRLITPRADPHEHESAFDYTYDSPAAARKGLDENEVEPEESATWVLCRVAIEPL